MKNFFTKAMCLFGILAGCSFAEGFNIGATAIGGVYNMIGMSDADGPKLFPGEGGLGGAISIDAMIPFSGDLALRTGVMGEFRNFSGHRTEKKSPECEGCKAEKWDDNVTVDLLYLEFPVLVRTHASPTVILEGGPVVGLNLLSQYYGPYKPGDEGGKFNKDWIDLSDETNFVEVGFTANLVLQMNDNLEMCFRLAYMIFDVLDSDELGYKLSTQTFKFQGGFTYWFGGGLEPPKATEETSPDMKAL